MNGSQHELDGWREFIGEQRAEHRAIMQTLVAIQKWQAEHDTMESGWHAKIAAHIASAGERHQHVEDKFKAIEKEQDTFHREHRLLKEQVEQLKKQKMIL